MEQESQDSSSEKYFMFMKKDYTSSDRGQEEFVPHIPYFLEWNKILGDRKHKPGDLYTLSNILNLTLSETNKKILKSLKEGSGISVSTLSRTSKLWIFRVSQSNVEKKNRITEIKQQIQSVKNEIQDSIPQHLVEKLKLLENSLKEISKY